VLEAEGQRIVDDAAQRARETFLLGSVTELADEDPDEPFGARGRTDLRRGPISRPVLVGL